MNQDDFAEIGGVKRRAQSSYETNERNPDANYLARIAAAGADVGYILTGIRKFSSLSAIHETTGDFALEPREKALVENIRECSEEDRRAIERLALRVSETQPEADEKLNKAG